MTIPIKGFLETSFLDWPGKICSVLFLPRCNFRCPYCHNHSLVLRPQQFVTIPWVEVFNRLLPFKSWIDGICLTGGEPTLHPDLPFLAGKIKKQGFLVKLDTNGSNPEMLERLIREEKVDFVSMDVKAPLDFFSYRNATGGAVDLDSIVKSIRILKRGHVEYRFRMTVVPTLHREEDIRTLARQLDAGRRLMLQNFNPENPLDPLFAKIRPYDSDRLKEIERDIQQTKFLGEIGDEISRGRGDGRRIEEREASGRELPRS